ncbi:MAG: hypothetical protein N3A65_00420 [candidate division WOR-3 bacterium]|nr:hypothetical protein [candidate division WOR-3 bacterium]
MRIFYLAFALAIISCAQNATVEFGFNDGTLLTGTFGDLVMDVTKIEILQERKFVEIWKGSKITYVPVSSDEYNSITDGYIPVSPGYYKEVRITIDSLIYKIDNTTVVLIDSTYQFTANAFTELLLEENHDYRLVISIASANWFSPDSQKIKTGHQPFEGASLKLYY